MNTNVNRLLELDRAARQMLDEAQQYYDRTLYETEEEKKKMLADYSERGKLHIEALKNELDDEVSETLQQVRSRTAAIDDEMKKAYEINEHQWVSEIVSRCLGRDSS